MTISNRLPVLEANIKAAHEACASAARTSIDHAIECGQLLIEAKELLKHGEWLPWLQGHCGLSERSAQRYMRIARNAAKSATVADLGVAAADRLLASSGQLPLDDLSRGAFGVDHANAVCVHIKPCGRRGIYVGCCHIIVLRFNDSDDGTVNDSDDGTVRRTLEAVHESEIVAWLHHHGGVNVDAVHWTRGVWQPEPDTYRVEKLLARERLSPSASGTGPSTRERT